MSLQTFYNKYFRSITKDSTTQIAVLIVTFAISFIWDLSEAVILFSKDFKKAYNLKKETTDSLNPLQDELDEAYSTISKLQEELLLVNQVEEISVEEEIQYEEFPCDLNVLDFSALSIDFQERMQKYVAFHNELSLDEGFTSNLHNEGKSIFKDFEPANEVEQIMSNSIVSELAVVEERVYTVGDESDNYRTYFYADDVICTYFGTYNVFANGSLYDVDCVKALKKTFAKGAHPDTSSNPCSSEDFSKFITLFETIISSIDF